MKKPLHILLGAGFALVALSSYSSGPANNGLGNRTGSAGSVANCSQSGCHAANNSSLQVGVVLLDNNLPVTSYQVGKTYRVLLTGIAPNTTLSRFGFQISCVKASNTSQQAGTLTVGGRANTAPRTASSISLIEHSSPLTGTTVGSTVIDTVSFLWTPTTSMGTVRFYAILNAVNNNGSTSGDMPNATTADITEATTGIAGVSQNLIGMYPNPVSSMLHVPVKAGMAEVSVFDALGRKIQNMQFAGSNDREVSLNVANLPTGQYVLQVMQGAGRQTASFVKN